MAPATQEIPESHLQWTVDPTALGSLRATVCTTEGTGTEAFHALLDASNLREVGTHLGARHAGAIHIHYRYGANGNCSSYLVQYRQDDRVVMCY